MKRTSAFAWGELIVGIALIVLGILTFVSPSRALTGIIFLYGILAILTGIVDIVFYIQMERHTGFGPVVSLVTGILSILAGALLIFYPIEGGLAFAVFFPLWFLAHCISRLTQLPMIRAASGNGAYYFTLIINIIGLVVGFLVLFHPILSLFSIGYFIGFYLILIGADHVVLGACGVWSRY